MVTEVMQTHRDEPYYGRVIDGPFEGAWIGSDSPHFVGHFKRRIDGYSIESNIIPSCGFEIDRVIYKWLPTYRAWAWWQPTVSGKKM